MGDIKKFQKRFGRRQRQGRQYRSGWFFSRASRRFIIIAGILCVWGFSQFKHTNLNNQSSPMRTGASRNTEVSTNKILISTKDNLIACNNPYVIDGDTFSCGNYRIRLSSIDAPEMPEHCRPGRRCTSGDPFASRDYLHSLSRGLVTCSPIETDSYGRVIALCEVNGQDLSCAMVKSGHAVERYRPLSCP